MSNLFFPSFISAYFLFTRFLFYFFSVYSFNIYSSRCLSLSLDSLLLPCFPSSLLRCGAQPTRDNHAWARSTLLLRRHRLTFHFYMSEFIFPYMEKLCTIFLLRFARIFLFRDLNRSYLFSFLY